MLLFCYEEIFKRRKIGALQAHYEMGSSGVTAYGLSTASFKTFSIH